ncbi:MAG: hypothetical protein IPH48_10880 [bacterium]|nr:hypothetical protein [bacterium]
MDLTVDNLLRSLWARELEAADATSVPFVWFWPHGRQGCITMTHDVETSRGLEATVELAALDVSHGFRPSFQFIPETRYSTPVVLLETLRAMNAEINIHGLNHDGHLFDSERVFADRASKINRYGRDFRARGFRSPILYRNPDWFHYLDFEYDMSFPNVAHLDPQRGGCCTVFPYFIGEKLELPLTTVQDYSLFHVLNDYSIDIWRRQLDIIASANGLASFNIHPDYVTSEREHAVYVELLAYLQSQVSTRNLWSASPGDVATWWRDRAAMTMEKSGIAGESPDAPASVPA